MDWVGWIFGFHGLLVPLTCRSPLRRTQVLSVVVDPMSVAVEHKEQLIWSHHPGILAWKMVCLLPPPPAPEQVLTSRDPTVIDHLTVLEKCPLNRKQVWTTTYNYKAHVLKIRLSS